MLQLYVQRILETNLSGTQRKLSPVIELLPVEAQMLTITSEVVTPKLLAREAKAREAAAGIIQCFTCAIPVHYCTCNFPDDGLILIQLYNATRGPWTAMPALIKVMSKRLI